MQEQGHLESSVGKIKFVSARRRRPLPAGLIRKRNALGLRVCSRESECPIGGNNASNSNENLDFQFRKFKAGKASVRRTPRQESDCDGACRWNGLTDFTKSGIGEGDGRPVPRKSPPLMTFRRKKERKAGKDALFNYGDARNPQIKKRQNAKRKTANRTPAWSGGPSVPGTGAVE